MKRLLMGLVAILMLGGGLLAMNSQPYRLEQVKKNLRSVPAFEEITELNLSGSDFDLTLLIEAIPNGLQVKTLDLRGRVVSLAEIDYLRLKFPKTQILLDEMPPTAQVPQGDLVNGVIAPPREIRSDDVTLPQQLLMLLLLGVFLYISGMVQVQARA
jgi:hypothetical protein